MQVTGRVKESALKTAGLTQHFFLASANVTPQAEGSRNFLRDYKKLKQPY